jgi:hypothetical protein
MRNREHDLIIRAQSNVHSCMQYSGLAARDVDGAIERLPEHTDRLNLLSQQLWAMEDLARSVEHQLSEIHTELRTG